jgi:hypothetical protein
LDNRLSDRLPTIVNGALFAVTLYLTLSIPWNPPVWIRLADPYDYLHQSQMPLWHKQFFFPHKAPPTGHQPLAFFPRPFTVPLIYKLANSDPDVIVSIQKYIHCLSVWFFVSSLLPLVATNFVRYFLILSSYLLMSWWNILRWSIFLLSESLSMSLLLCWIASFLVLNRWRSIFALALHALITVLLAFTRDTWPYILLAFYTILLLFSLVSARYLIRFATTLLVLSIVIFAISTKSADIGERRTLPLLNTIILRIIPSDEYTRWFALRGLPLSDRLVAEFCDTAWLENRSRINPQAVVKIYQIYADPSYLDLLKWCHGKGAIMYTWFLLTHPRFAFLLQESPAQLRRILVYDDGFAPNPRGYSKLAQHVFPLFSPASLLVVLIASVALYAKVGRKILLYPVALGLVFCFNVFISYNADALEVERHLFITGVMIQVLSIMSLSLVVDGIWTQRAG